MQQELQQSAIGADAIQTGVTNAPEFEVLSAEMHGFGLRTGRIPDIIGPTGYQAVLPPLGVAHEPCTNENCARCTKSTGGPNLDGNVRAGDMTPDLGDPALESRTYHPLNEYIEEFSLDRALVGARFCEKPGPVPLGDTVTNLMRPSIAPDRHGGSASGRKRRDGCSPDFGEMMRRASTERPRYA